VVNQQDEQLLSGGRYIGAVSIGFSSITGTAVKDHSCTRQSMQ